MKSVKKNLGVVRVFLEENFLCKKEIIFKTVWFLHGTDNENGTASD